MTTSRRALLVGAGFAAGAALGLGVVAPTARTDGPALLRPPGARPEPEFLAACLRCGQCVEACSYDTLRLASLAAGLSSGTPHLDPRTVPCYLCADHDALMCVEACPSGALQPVAAVEDIRMGVAVLDEATCLARNDVMCRACWQACPLPGRAMTLTMRVQPQVEPEACIGCGLCEHACLTEPTSIAIRPASALAERER